MAGHARLSPSSAKIWMTCPAMPGMAERCAPTTSKYAEEGTLAHALAEECLAMGKNAADIPGPYPEDMAAAVQIYLDYVRSKTNKGDEFYVEDKLQLNDHIWGTADFVRYRPSTRHLLIADYKHGAGVFVGVEENPQALTYALMGAKKLGNRGVDKVTLAIVQPRCAADDGSKGIREWEFDAVELLEWEADLLDALQRTMEENARFVTGPHCRWCPAAAICPALKEQAQEAARKEFAPALNYKPEELSQSLRAIPALEAWIKATREFAFTEAQHGRGSPDHKLVQKRATRKWASEEEAADFLKSYGCDEKDIFERKIKSPPKIEALIGKKNKDAIKDLILAESSGITLVPNEDPRPAVSGDAALDFTPVDED